MESSYVGESCIEMISKEINQGIDLQYRPGQEEPKSNPLGNV